jgi:hypothetical protein
MKKRKRKKKQYDKFIQIMVVTHFKKKFNDIWDKVDVTSLKILYSKLCFERRNKRTGETINKALPEVYSNSLFMKTCLTFSNNFIYSQKFLKHK